MGLVRPAEEEEAVGLGWEGVGAAGVEKMQEVVVSCGRGVCLCASLEGGIRKERRGRTKKTYCSAQAYSSI